jgi:hypothetical protein
MVILLTIDPLILLIYIYLLFLHLFFLKVFYSFYFIVLLTRRRETAVMFKSNSPLGFMIRLTAESAAFYSGYLTCSLSAFLAHIKFWLAFLRKVYWSPNFIPGIYGRN